MFDHCPLIMETERIDRGLKPFRLVDDWFSYPKFISFVKKKSSLDGDGAVTRKFKKLKVLLKKWNKNLLGNIDQAIKKLESKQQRLDRMNETKDLDEVEKTRKLALQSYLERWYVHKKMY